MIKHYRISGVVQGVGYRAGARDTAMRLGLIGWVKNCRNGDVEALANGDATQLTNFEHWLRVGPRYAQVSHVQISIVEAADPLLESITTTFTIRY